MFKKMCSIKKILLLMVLLSILIIISVLIVYTLNGVKYIDNKYKEHFKLTSIKVPYYSNDADFFDLPKLYKKGAFILFTLNFSDDNKTFTVIYKNGCYYDDYQLEDIHKYATDYIKKITNNSQIQNVLFYNATSDYPCYNYYHPIRDYLSKNNQLITQENIDSVVRTLLITDDAEMTVFINDSFEDSALLLNSKEKTINLLNEELFINSDKNNKNQIIVCFTNYSLQTQRIRAQDISNGLRFDYYGFKNEPKIISYYELNKTNTNIDYIIEF